MTKSVKDAAAYLKDYIDKYDSQYNYENYRIETFIHDIVYGLGVSLDDDHQCAQGYDIFRKKLAAFLKDPTNKYEVK